MKRKYAAVDEVVAAAGRLLRLKHSRLYGDHMGMKVANLRLRARRRGYQKWYSLKKGVLTGILIMDASVRVIVKAFRRIVLMRRDSYIAQKAERGADNKCPICLTPLSDMQVSDLFLHDGVVFCKQDVIDYITSGYNFSNPITRKHISRHEIARLGCQKLLTMYGVRSTLRRREVESSSHFFFLENDVVWTYKNLLAAVDVSGTAMFREDLFRDAYVKFDSHVRQMFANDGLRTVCVLKGLKFEYRGMSDTLDGWSTKLIDSYLNSAPRV
ncbi:unnamed protein product [Ectocarpus sp. 6 AP-2014]